MPKATKDPSWINSAKSLQELWQHRANWIGDTTKARAFITRAIREGDFLVAYDAARETVEERHRADPWMQQQMALALAQLGSTARAQAILLALDKKYPTNRETLALLARTYKDQWSTDTSSTAALNSAFEYYKRAFEIDPCLMLVSRFLSSLSFPAICWMSPVVALRASQLVRSPRFG
jgi:predicted Zn-dependent protease